ncbi:MAG: aminotransferase class V-fold PLP-dependent enzyme [Bacteroidetes bacterium]|nr:aminotransferase class V-fold PLP-dependent enzyme [Bacteroidota bacterium]
MEAFFEQFRNNVTGINQKFDTAYGEKLMLYADWIASGRLYQPIEERISIDFGNFVGNTHTETSESGTIMTYSYHHSKEIIKKHVNAGPEDVLISAGFGMTGVINKFQRILGLKGCGINNYQPCKSCAAMQKKPVVFVSHMEHHSNHTSWYETVCDVVVVEPNEDLLVDLKNWEDALKKYEDRPLKFASITACSNVTGITTPYHEIAALMHKYKGLCFVDFAASAPYCDMDMHPENPEQALDAIFFSPHKFLGGPGSSGILVFNRNLYQLKSPDQPGGGTVDWTNAWGEYKYVDDIELREDGGTPGFLQTIKAALAIKLKEQMGVSNMKQREEELVKIAFEGFEKIKGVHILADNVKDRLGIISFYTEDIHFNLVVRLLNDRFGIQVRGGCACAGTYGHYLLHVGHSQSNAITEKINKGDLSMKPGWVRLSLHPTMSNSELLFIIDAIQQIVENCQEWEKDYVYSPKTNEFAHRNFENNKKDQIKKWFELN